MISLQEQREAQAAGFVECDSCGHPCEQHDNDACSFVFDDYSCPCDVRLTITDVNNIRTLYGLPRDYEG